MLRVISGFYKGKKLNQPDLKICRPTTDRTKEALFSMIQFKIKGSIFLDLFSGSGSISIEASSRGAMKVISIESNASSIKVIKENLETIKIKNVTVIKSQVDNFLNTMGGTKFDFIFLDPPYEDKILCNETIDIIQNKKILKKEGQIIIETSNPKELVIPKELIITKSKKYGKSYIIFVSNII